jgi:putative membrane protein
MFVRVNAAIAAMCLLSGAAFAQSAPKPTDSQIIYVVYNAGLVDSVAARQAIARSKNEDVIAFANDMVKDHEAMNKQVLDLVKKLNIKPEDNETSRSLSWQAADKQSTLVKLSGAAYDKVYIDSEIAYHKTLNGVLENVLIPSATDPELKSLLQTDLKILQGHQQHAEQVAATFK